MGLEACTEDLSWTQEIQSWLATPQETETCPIAEGSLPTACPPSRKTLLLTLLPWAVAHPMGRCLQEVQSSWKALRLARILSDQTALRHNFQELKVAFRSVKRFVCHAWWDSFSSWNVHSWPQSLRYRQGCLPVSSNLQIAVTAEFCEMLLLYKLLIYCQTWPGTCFIVQASHDLMSLWPQSPKCVSIGVYLSPGSVFVCGLIFSKHLAS